MTLPAEIALSFDDLSVEYFVSVIAGVTTEFVPVVIFLFPGIKKQEKGSDQDRKGIQDFCKL